MCQSDEEFDIPVLRDGCGGETGESCWGSEWFGWWPRGRRLREEPLIRAPENPDVGHTPSLIAWLRGPCPPLLEQIQ